LACSLHEKSVAISGAIAYFCLIWQVEIPKIEYNGQKLIMLVKVNTPDNTSNIIPIVPTTMLVK
jgi:hypothetical protein